jgi:hypothetical protein
MVDVYDILTYSDSYQKRIKEEHEAGGIYRSGEGTEAEIM